MPSSPYSSSKASSDLLSLSYYRTYKLPILLQDVLIIMGRINIRKN